MRLRPPAMKRYYERVSPGSKPLMSRGLMGEAFRDIKEVSLLDQLEHYLRYVHLRWRLDHEPDKDAQKELTLAAMRYTFAADAAKKFDEPRWALQNRAPKPWLVDAPVTREETERWFREGLDYFQPSPGHIFLK